MYLIILSVFSPDENWQTEDSPSAVLVYRIFAFLLIPAFLNFFISPAFCFLLSFFALTDIFADVFLKAPAEMLRSAFPLI